MDGGVGGGSVVGVVGAHPRSCRDEAPASNTLTPRQRPINATQPLWLTGYGHNNMPLPLCNTYVAKFVRKLAEELEARKELPNDADVPKEGCSVM